MANLFRLCLFVAIWGGCASLTVREHFTRYGLPRASLDLDCPREKIELVQVDQPLDQPLYSGGVAILNQILAARSLQRSSHNHLTI